MVPKDVFNVSNRGDQDVDHLRGGLTIISRLMPVLRQLLLMSLVHPHSQQSMPGAGQAVSGMSGEFFRYRHVYVHPPTDRDRAEAIDMALDVRCDVCKVIVLGAMSKAESMTEDHLLDQLEGPLDEGARPIEGDEQGSRVVMNKRGCNKLYKDDLMALGWRVRKCDVSNVQTFCLVREVSQ